MFNFLYTIFILFFPFYLFSSGQPQISHLILALLFAFILLKMPSQFLNSIRENRRVMIFMIYIIYINFIWLILTEKTSFFIYTLFYLFNVLLFYSTYLLYENSLISDRVIRRAIFFTLLLQFIFLLKSGLSFNTRNMLFFNNPNQLGYFAIAIINIYFILGVNQKEGNRGNLEVIQNILVYIFAFILILFSSSKASIFSYMIILIYIFYIELIKRVNSLKILISGVLAISLTALLIANFNTVANMAENTALFNRTENIGTESDDSLAGRGYDRIVEYPKYLLFGAGEGDFNRFALSHHKGELHSTVANILFSYGIVGFIIFISFFLNSKFYIKRVLFYMFPILLYGLSHNGIRSPLFWIALAISFEYSKREGEKFPVY